MRTLALAAAGALLTAACAVPEETRFGVLPLGAPLPSAQECADRVDGGDETVPANEHANRATPERASMPVWEDFTARVNREYVPRIDGRFTGTTAAILEWGACKWGLDVDVLRATAYQESSWEQATEGDMSEDPEDCVGGAVPPCPTSFGVLQLKATDLPGSFPHSRDSTAFNVDYYGARMRSCYEGQVTYLGNGYGPGDLWSCVGWHWSGQWRDVGALAYIGRVQRHLAHRSWKELAR